MRKRWFISLIIGIIITGGCLGYLQFGRDMDVYGSHAMTSDNYHEERLTVVVNKVYVEDQKVCAEEIVRRCRENSFKSVRFSYDQSVPNALYVTVYSSKRQAEKGKQMFSFSKTQCAVFKGTDRAVFLDKREFTGPIYTQIEEAVDFVLRNIRLGATIDGLVRKEKYELPPEAIREMIINAHCHRNLLDESCIQVAVYDDRLEVTSPGGLYNGLTYEEVMNGHSKIRNKGIANIFSQMGLVEAWGSGIKRILNAAEEYGLPKPKFQEFDNMFRVELFRNSFPMTNEKENIGEASEKHRRNIGSRVENRPQRYTAKDYKIAFRRSSIISG